MRTLAKFFLWLIGIAIPVVIAACYGMPARFSKSGKVIDSVTKQGIEGIQVTCVDGWGLSYDATAHAYVGGEFTLWYDDPCSELRLEDIDAEANGLYQPRAVPFCHECESLTIELTREP